MKKIVLFFLLPVHALFCGNQGETGKPLITTYQDLDIGVNFQSWSFVEDKKGIIYIGSAPGVFQFDGSTWRSIPVSNGTFARSLAIDKNDRVYVGASGDFGYLEPDKKGELHFVSLLKLVNEEVRNLTYIWTTHITDSGIYFQAMEHIFRFTPGKTNKDWKIKIWNPKSRFNFAFWYNNIYYVQQAGIGLMKMVNDSLVLLPGGEQFANDRLQIMLPYKKNNQELILVGTFNRGLFLFDGKSFTPFNCQADSYLRKSTLYCGSMLPDESYVFGMLDGGIIVMDTDGNIKMLLDKENGLSGNSVISLYVDKNGLLWSAPEGSISIVEYSSPVTVYDESKGQFSAIASIIRHKGILYNAQTNGIFYLDKNTSSFKELEGFLPGNNQSFHFLVVNDQLLTAQGTGLYKIDGTKVQKIKGTEGTDFLPQFIHRSQKDTNRIFIAMLNGLASFYYDKKKNEWIEERQISLDYVVTIAEPEPGVLFLGTNGNGIYSFSYTDSLPEKPLIKEYNFRTGYPYGGTLVIAAGKSLFTLLGDGLYKYNKTEDKFIIDTSFVSRAEYNYFDSFIASDEKGNLWITSSTSTKFFRMQEDGSYKFENTAASRISRDIISAVYTDQDGVVWLGGQNMFRLDPKSSEKAGNQFNTLVRRVLIGDDSVIYGGTLQNGKIIPEINYADNSVMFEYSAASFQDPRATEYRSFLEGFDEKWSSWSKETRRNYTNLPPGDYVFKVKGKNVYSMVSKEAQFHFSILAPWYRTFGAYIFYALVFITGVVSVDRLQRKRVFKKELERSRIREMELQTEAALAESKALQAENERNKNVELLSEMGKEITASLDLDTIFLRVYDYINQLADATIFGIGIYQPEKNQIEYKLALEKGKRYPPYSRDTRDKNQFPVWCIMNRKPVFINNVTEEYKNYIEVYKEPNRTLEDGSLAEEAFSIIYLPLISKNQVLGVITIQSFHKNAYTEHHLNIVQNLAAYSAIAIDNADAYRKLNKTIQKLDGALSDLKTTQDKLIVQEKLASLGQLTAGIAHEIKNPLNFVNNFAELSKELVTELKEEYEKVRDILSPDFRDNFEDLLSNILLNVTKTNEHGKRADSIVRSMLQHSRGKSGDRLPCDLNSMLEEDINLAYHGLRARDASFNITIEKEFDTSLEKITIVPQDVSRVFLNIINNGFYEANRKKKSTNGSFVPTLRIKTVDYNDRIEVLIRDNGNGVPPEARDKLFNPFFTTKPAGEGTGLGLSLSYDIIVQQHGGEIKFDTKMGEYTEFIIVLPKNGRSKTIGDKT